MPERTITRRKEREIENKCHSTNVEGLKIMRWPAQRQKRSLVCTHFLGRGSGRVGWAGITAASGRGDGCGDDVGVGHVVGVGDEEGERDDGGDEGVGLGAGMDEPVFSRLLSTSALRAHRAFHTSHSAYSTARWIFRVQLVVARSPLCLIMSRKAPGNSTASRPHFAADTTS